MKQIVIKFFQALAESLRNREYRNFTIRILVITVILFFVYYLAEGFKDNKNYIEKSVRMSVYNPGSSGTMALKEFLESMNIKTEKILRPLIKFSAKNDKYNRNAILIIEPEAVLEAVDIDAIGLKAKEGNNILVFTSHESKIANFFSPRKKEIKFKPKEEIYFSSVKISKTNITDDPYNIFNDINAVELRNKKRFKKWSGDWEIFVKDEAGVIALIKKNEERIGDIVLFSDSQFLSNNDIRNADNGIFSYRLIKHFSGNKVYFDEYYHGFSQSYTILYFFANKEYLFIILQIFIFIILLLIPAGIKFGQYKNIREPDDDKIFYFSKGLAGLMNKKKYRDDVLKLMIKNYKRMLTVKPDYNSGDKLKKLNQLSKSKKSSGSLMHEVFRIVNEK